MDWSKAKSILILVFVAVNIFLAVNIGIVKMRDGIPRDTVLNTKAILKDRGVDLKCDLPKYNADTGMLQFDTMLDLKSRIAGKIFGNTGLSYVKTGNGEEYASGNKKLAFQNGNDFTYKDDKPDGKVDITNRTEVEKFVKAFLDGTGLPVSRYFMDDFRVVSNGEASIILREKYNSTIIFDNYVGAWVSGTGIVYMESRYKEIKGSTPSNKIMPAYAILLKNFTKDSGLAITNIEIGFKSKSESGTKDLYSSPAWRITTANNDRLYFNAYDGEKMAYEGDK